MCAVAAIEFENNGAGADEEPDESCKQVEGKNLEPPVMVRRQGSP